MIKKYPIPVLSVFLLALLSSAKAQSISDRELYQKLISAPAEEVQPILERELGEQNPSHNARFFLSSLSRRKMEKLPPWAANRLLIALGFSDKELNAFYADPHMYDLGFHPAIKVLIAAVLFTPGVVISGIGLVGVSNGHGNAGNTVGFGATLLGAGAFFLNGALKPARKGAPVPHTDSEVNARDILTLIRVCSYR